jgi:hypothetical protein
MWTTCRSALATAFSLFTLGVVLLAPGTRAQSTTGDEAEAIAQEAYVFLYPLITMDVTRKQLINLDPKVSPVGGPANGIHSRAHISTRRDEERRPSEFRHALFERVA